MTKISQMAPAIALTGEELIEVVQGGVSKRITAQALFARGQSAYDIAKSRGFVGNKDLWLASLVGPKGASAYDLAVQDGFVGSLSDWLLSFDGDSNETVISLSRRLEELEAQSTETQYLVSAMGVRTYAFGPSLTWNVLHNLSTVNFVESIRSSSGQRLYAGVQTLDENQFVINFTEPEAGTVSVFFHAAA